DTLTDLRGVIGSDTAPTSKPVIVMGGYAAVGDGGGGVFYWDKSSSSGDNGGTGIVPTNSTTGRWVPLYTGAIEVRWFGAGLGGADDSAKIQQAIETAIHVPGGGGATVHLPAGTYNVQHPIYIETSDTSYGGWIGVRIVGDGKFNTHVRITG